nr:hypothetical protein [uncultured Desulfobulbus sp.]
MEFELEDFESKEGPAINLEKEDEQKISPAEKGKRHGQARRSNFNFWRNFRKYSINYSILKLVLLPIVLIIFAFILPKIFEYAAKEYFILLKGQQATAKKPTSIQNFQTPNLSYYSKYIPRPDHQNSIKTHKKNEKQVMYSWIDENGHKAFSNIGFPENEKYTEGKIEWY